MPTSIQRRERAQLARSGEAVTWTTDDAPANAQPFEWGAGKEPASVYWDAIGYLIMRLLAIVIVLLLEGVLLALAFRAGYALALAT